MLKFILLLLFNQSVFSQETGFYPQIHTLSPADNGFRQYLSDVESNRRRISGRMRSHELAEYLTIYQYTPGEGEDLLMLAARCNIPYSALASLNRLTGPASVKKGVPLLLPSCPGIFLPDILETEIEKITGAVRFSHQESVELKINIEGTAHVFHFFPGSDFTMTERAFFLNPGFRFPLRTYRLTSGYGARASPFTGNPSMHYGIDLAAPEGTDVYSISEGTVTETGYSDLYGNYIIINHNDNMSSMYGHLKKIYAALHETVKSSTIIGIVGSTGQSTGPHLHFELHQNGKPIDPDGRLRPLF